ncbi:vesicle transport v-SNARE protein N-terminus-domain-containing protein [Polychytrium aggregatum]|uniref:vesicle transport v-SNARE protein N-terminus-domain-containing protein n=1 Tax=Polychytrium aggregatum TaxID=110093 RepID=UPI0022FDEE96|nr:vesicle transport v-SNARE protein N-terminus-domain-containing protein [Polychytrium aggregatum]KAI9203697.1 vesicle transport v-SNARE protein N-terminus-domain-containing protein [Polychytrium aggregatum]
MSGSEIFETYQKEYLTLQESISDKVKNLIPQAKPDQRKLLFNQATRELEEADEIISQMEVELQSLPPNIRNPLTPRLKSYKNDVKTLKKDLQKTNSAASDREQLLGAGGSHVIDFEVTSMDQRSRLLQGTERLQDGSRRLEEARRIAIETENVGISTLETLNRQREQILRTRDTLSSADTWITKSQGILKTMQRRLVTNKFMTAGIIAILVVIIAVIIYLKWG